MHILSPKSRPGGAVGTLPLDELRRTARQMNLPGFGITQQTKLSHSHVLVIGAGGLGCPLMQTLAATGVGHITCIDDDTVDLSNIHRQILFGAGDVGRPKVDVVAEALPRLQPGVNVTVHNARFDARNAVELLSGVDVLIDGSDTFATKFLAADAAEITGTPLLFGSVLRYRGDVALWWSGPGAGVDGVGLRDLYPEQPPADFVPDCATAGVLGVTTSVVGGLMATEAVKFLSGVGTCEVGVLHTYDALATTITRFRVRRDPQRPLVTAFGDYAAAACAVDTHPSDGDHGAGKETRPIIEQADALIDVREPHEKALHDLDRGGINLPTSTWDNDSENAAAIAVLDSCPGPNVVVYCASGARSRRFVDTYEALARARGLRLTSLPGGIGT